MLVTTFSLPKIFWTPQEEASATKLVKKALQIAHTGSVLEALTFTTAALGFDTFAFGMVANDRRPNADSDAYILTNQSKEWVRMYEERAFIEFDPRVELAWDPGPTFWEARDFEAEPRYRAFLSPSFSTEGVSELQTL